MKACPPRPFLFPSQAGKSAGPSLHPPASPLHRTRPFASITRTISTSCARQAHRSSFSAPLRTRAFRQASTQSTSAAVIRSFTQEDFPPTLRCSTISGRGARRAVPFMRNAAASCTSAGRYAISKGARSTPSASSPSTQSWKRKAPTSATARCSWMATACWARKESASGATSSDIRTSAPMKLQAGPTAYTVSKTDRAGRCRPRDTCARKRSQAIYTSISEATSAYRPLRRLRP